MSRLRFEKIEGGYSVYYGVGNKNSVGQIFLADDGIYYFALGNRGWGEGYDLAEDMIEDLWKFIADLNKPFRQDMTDYFKEQHDENCIP
jgi:hypothetical protein